MIKRKYSPLARPSTTKTLVGMRFGKLVVTECLGRHKSRTYYLCYCDCGGTSEVSHSGLKNGSTNSCGCSHWDHKRKHGLAHTSEYTAWQAMKARCSNPNADNHRWYAGTEIDPEWFNDFGAFIRDMGPKPTPSHSIERMDNGKGYGPGNCRWATQTEQCNNRRNSHFVIIDGIRKTIAEWAREVGTPYSTIQARIRRGWSEEDAIRGPR
jgi:hypothetical protein